MSQHNQKGTQLIGGSATEEVLASSKSVLQKTMHGGQKGLQQFFTPETAAKLAHIVIGEYVAVLDPTAGDGSFLKFWTPPYSFGVEIDEDQVKNAEGGYNPVRGDIQEVYTLLKLASPSWSAIVCNPPFGLQWQDPTVHGGKTMNSAKLAFLYCHRLLADDGQLVFIDARDNFYKHIADLPEAAGIYAVVECEDLGKRANFGMPCVIAFGIHPGNRSPESTGYVKRECNVEMLDLMGDWVKEHREAALGRYNYLGTHTYAHHGFPDTFKAIQKEYDRRANDRFKKDREYDAQLVGGNTVQWMPSGYVTLALRQTGDEYAFRGLNNQSVNYFVQNERLWNKLIGYEQTGLLRIDPRLKTSVDELLLELRKIICPLYKLKPQQRLGYLTDIEFLACVKDDPDRGFAAGESYRLSTKTETVRTSEERVVDSKTKPGEYEVRTFTKQQKMLSITIGHHTIRDGGEAASENIAWLVEHFDLPEPGDVASRHPAQIEAAEQLVQEIMDEFAENSLVYEEAHPEVFKYSHRNFQKRDIARLVFKGGGLLSWEQGLGKTFGGLMFSEACVRNGAQDAVLIVTAKDLIPQWQREIERFTGKKATLIRNHGQAKAIAKRLRTPGESGLYITYYEALSIVGTRKSQPEDHFTVYEKEEHKQVKGTGRYGYSWLEEKTGEDGAPANVCHPVKNPYETEDLAGNPIPEDAVRRYRYIPPRYDTILRAITTKEVCPECRADTRNGWNGLYCEAELDNGTICGYAHYKVRVRPISSILSQAFRHGVIVMDEITLIQGDTSKRSKALRGLAAKHKLGMTGTPIKNFVGQAFWLLWWCLGNGSKRFGYTYDGGRAQFEADFSVIEWAQDKRGRLMNRKPLPEVTNLSMLWRLLASSIIRRRKEETGEDLMPKYYYPIRVPLGHGQVQQIAKWLKDFPKFFEEKYPDAPIVKAGMHEIMAPMLGLQQKLDYACTIPLADPNFDWTGVEVSNYTPAMLRVVELAMALSKQGRKVLIGSNLVKTSEFIAQTLSEKGVKAIHILDESGTTLNPDKRAQRVYSFQTDDVEVFCAGVKAIRLGHNLDAANAVILHGLDWDYETLDQFINRVHRLTSTEPVDIYIILPTTESGDTITTKKWSVLEMKGGAADLALDGRLVEKLETEVDQSQIIREMVERGICATADDLPEYAIEDAWKALPMRDEYEPPEDLIPPRPVVTITEEQAVEAIGEFLVLYYDAIVAPTLAACEVLGAFLVAFAPEPAEDVIPLELVQEQNAVEMDEQVEDYEEAVAIAEEIETSATNSPGPSPDATTDLLLQMQEQLAALTAQVTEQAVKNAELEAELERLSNPEQLSLLTTEV